MGRGDKKTAKGKRAMGSYGNTRKKKSSTTNVAPTKSEKTVKTVKKSAAKKSAAKTESTAAKKTSAKKPATKKAVKKDAE